MGHVFQTVFSRIISNCNCPTHKKPDNSDAFSSINCVRFGRVLTTGSCGDHGLDVYQVHKVTSFPRPCGFWEDDYEWVTEIPNQLITNTYDLHSPPCNGPDYRSKTITENKTINTSCEFGFGDQCCDYTEEVSYGEDCVAAGDPFETYEYSGANTIGQHIAAGNISYYQSCNSSDCREGFTYLSGPYSKFPAFMYGTKSIIKREAKFGLKATRLMIGLKYKYGYTVWRTLQPTNGTRSWSKVQDFRGSFIATSDEEEINPIPSNWNTLTNEERWGSASGFTTVPNISGYEYYINNFGIIQDFGDTSCNSWINGEDDGT